jgi:hypothetical protein
MAGKKTVIVSSHYLLNKRIYTLLAGFLTLYPQMAQLDAEYWLISVVRVRIV